MTEEELHDVEFYLKTSSDEEICKMADQGDPAANHIYHEIWDESKRKAISARVDKAWKDQWKDK